MKKLWLFSIILAGLAGCAHESTITPSQGHIGSGQETQAAAVPAGEIPKPVKNPGYVPPPKPKGKEQTYSVVVSDVPVKEILFALARESKVNVDIHPNISGNVTLNAVDQTLTAILERISKQVDMRYKFEGNTLSITPDIPTLHTYKVNYVNMERDTNSTIGVASQIASTGMAASTGSSGSSSTSGSGNNSNTLVSSTSKNNFWELLTDNIKTILRTTKSQAAVEQETRDAINAASYALNQSSEKNGENPDAQNAKQSKESRETLQKIAKEQAKDAQVKDQVIVNPVAGMITVMATERQHQFLQQYIDTLAASVERQVLIEATIVEVTLSDGFQTGIDWSRLGANGSNSGITFKQSLNSLPLTVGGSAIGNSLANQFVVGYANNTTLGQLAGSIKMLEAFGNTKVLSSPKLMAINNQTAILKVVNNLVYFNIQANTTTTSTGPSLTTYTTTPQTVPIGVVMSVTPQINNNGVVTLNIRPTISRQTGTALDPNPNLTANGVQNPVPIIEVREMESVLQVNSGQTAILGGLMVDDIEKSNNSVPGISSWSIFGKLFQAKNSSAQKTELVIFIRPTVITNPSLDGNELAKFREYLPSELPVVTSDEPAN